MSADPGFLVLLSAGMFGGALISSFAGLAFAPVAAILLIAVLEPATLVPLLMICSVLVQLAGLIRARRRIVWAHSDAMLLGGAIGVPLAVVALPSLDPRLYQLGFGLFLLAYAVAMLVRPLRHRLAPANPKRELLVGICGGLVGGLTAMPGAIPALYCDLRGTSRPQRRAVVQPYALAMQLLALGLLALNGDIPAKVGWHLAAALPALALGTVAGIALFGRLPDVGFRRSVLVLLLATGVGAMSSRDVVGVLSPEQEEVVSLPGAAPPRR